MKKLILFFALLATIATNSAWGMEKEKKENPNELIQKVCKKFNIPYHYDQKKNMIIVDTKQDKLKEKHLTLFANIAKEEIELSKIENNDDLFEVAKVASILKNEKIYNLCSKKWLNRIYADNVPIIYFHKKNKVKSGKRPTFPYLQKNSDFIKVEKPTIMQLRLINIIYRNHRNGQDKTTLNEEEKKIFNPILDPDNYEYNSDNAKNLVNYTYVWSTLSKKQ